MILPKKDIQMRKNILSVLIFYAFCTCFDAKSQDFKIDDKVPIPIPLPTNAPEKPTKEINEAAFIEGMKFYIIEEYAKALVIFEKTLKNDSENSALNFQIASTHFKLNNLEKAIPFAKKAFELNKNNIQYGEMVAGLHAKNGDFQNASNVYKFLFEKFPSNSEIGLNLAATYYSQGKYEEVLKIYELIELNLGPSQELSNQKQQLLLKLNRPKDAIAEGEKLIKADPNEVENYIDQAELLIRNNKETEAIGFIDKALKINPESGQAHILLADIARRKNDLAGMYQQLNLACADKNLEGGALAKILFNFLESVPETSDSAPKEKLISKIIEIHPHEPRGYLMMGDMLYIKGSKKEANENYLKAINFEKNNNQIWQRILAIDNELSAFKEQIAHSEAAIELYPNQAIFWYYSGSANFMLNKNEPAIEALEEAQRLAGDEKELNIVIYSILGETYNRIKKHEKSDEAYNNVLKLDPTNDGVANNYSYYLALRNQKLDYAAEIAAKVVERNPTNSTFLDTYGWVLYIKKDFEKAKQYLEKAYQFNGGKSGVIAEHYGDVLFKVGEKDKAMEIWKKAILLAPNNKELEKKIAEGRMVE